MALKKHAGLLSCNIVIYFNFNIGYKSNVAKSNPNIC